MTNFEWHDGAPTDDGLYIIIVRWDEELSTRLRRLESGSWYSVHAPKYESVSDVTYLEKQIESHLRIPERMP